MYIRKKPVPRARVSDGSAEALLLGFKNPAVFKGLGAGDRCLLWGIFSYSEKYRTIQSGDFEIEKESDTAAVLPAFETGAGGGSRAAKNRFGTIQPVYRLGAGLRQWHFRALIAEALAAYAARIDDELPAAVIEKRALLAKKTAVRAVHFPRDFDELERARRTLVYEELFYLEIMIALRLAERRGRLSDAPAATPACAEAGPLQRRLIERLPFKLTAGQTDALAVINADIDRGRMARLLQGDVGSGKTLVSFMAALRAAEGGAQSVIMAPTELLAYQHACNAARLLEPLGLHVAFLTGNLKSAGRKNLLAALASGDIDIAVGTHALFSRDVSYRNLKLVVIDEQHRFGVTQRQAILEKGAGGFPNLLMMSATPIPRTLTQTVFGDMDVSVIRDMPPGRKPVVTRTFSQHNEAKVYGLVRRELEAGRQAYFVYPLISGDGAEDEESALKDAQSMARRLADEVFPEYKTALLHSKLGDDEKKAVMERFRSGAIRILAATSVVEVGVDVPNATCMVIEHAERFGLSALHQLRGRVGRGDAESVCFLVWTDPEEPLAREASGETLALWQRRLKAMRESADGFVIAEEDWRLRGPGQITGTEQSGYGALGIADLIRDAKELEAARADAFEIVARDPGLRAPENAVIAQTLARARPFTVEGA